MKNWPKLSETLPYQRHPNICQGCGAGGLDLAARAEHQRWIECDEDDKPTAVVVLLCKACSEREIEKHPRLYESIPKNAPRPGTMELCLECRHRDGLACKHPDAKANGGAGIAIFGQQPTRGFWDGTDKRGRRTGGVLTIYPTPPQRCAGREATGGWQPIATAPKGVHVMVRMADGTVHESAHWASDRSGEEQPPFEGWFIRVDKERKELGFLGIDDPIAWLAIEQEETPKP